MSQSEQLIVCAAAVIALLYLVGLSAVWRIVKMPVEWLLVILVVIWAL